MIKWTFKCWILCLSHLILNIRSYGIKTDDCQKDTVSSGVLTFAFPDPHQIHFFSTVPKVKSSKWQETESLMFL